MKQKSSFWRGYTEDWKPTLIIALPIFCFALWYATRRGYTNLFLYVVVIALASWHVAGMAVLTYRKFMAYRRQKEEAMMPRNIARPESRQ